MRIQGEKKRERMQRVSEIEHERERMQRVSEIEHERKRGNDKADDRE